MTEEAKGAVDGALTTGPRRPILPGMSLAVYIAHSVAEAEIAVLWELQASAATHGISAKLASYRPSSALTASRKAELDRSDAIIAIATRPSAALEAELSYAVQLGKPVFVYRLERTELKLPKKAVDFVIEPGTTSAQLLSDVADHLRKAKPKLPQDEETSSALGALLGIGALLLVLSLLSSKEWSAGSPPVP